MTSNKRPLPWPPESLFLVSVSVSVQNASHSTLHANPPPPEQVSERGSGAPVVATADMPAGTAVMRGHAWAWGDQDGEKFAVGSTHPVGQEGGRG